MRTSLVVVLEDLKMNKIALAFLLLGGLALAGCDGAPPPADGGPGDGGATDAPAQPDAPRVLETRPANGEREVARDAALAIVFDRAMDESAGSLSLSAGGETIALEAGAWDEEGRVFTVQPSAPLPPSATIAVTASGFESAEGAGLSAAHAWSFETRDDVAPFVTSTTPEEGATEVDPDLATIVIAFSEPMRDSGVPRLEGGPGELGRGAWMDGALHLPVSGLAADTAYRLVLDGFRDAAGNALDGAPVLGDGALDFTTGEDVTAPVVVDANPSEGQLDVRVGLVTRIALDFSEPMDTSAGSATLEVAGGSEALALEWSRGDTRVSLPVASLLRIDSPHRVVLEGFRDIAGNALDGATYLGDGALDFTTGEGALSPFVAHTEPLDAVEVSAVGISVIRVVFSEAMDRSQTTAVLSDGSLDRTLHGTWNEAGTVLTLDARGYVHASSSYSMDLTGFTDATGSPIDVSHPYLGDGVLQFTTPAGTGERCGDELGMDVATPITGGVEWVIPSGAVTFDDGAASCRSSNGGADAVVHYRKTTAAAADGGTALHITASMSAAINLAVFQDRCDIGDAATMRRCVFNRNPWETYVDGGPGDYFIWVGRNSSTGAFNGATVRVEEVASSPEGESCLSPLDTTTAAPIYTAPEEPGDPHRWTIPQGFAQSFDVGVGIGMPGAISCAPDLRHGPDSVVRLDKATATSLMTVRFTAAGTGSGTNLVRTHIEVVDSCDPDTRSSLGCYRDLVAADGAREVTIDGAAGPRYVWIGTQNTNGQIAGATVEALEFEPQPGDSCATAIPLTPGTTNTVTANRPYRAHAPSCLASDGLTWFRFTTRQGLTILNANGPTLGAVVDAATGKVLRCGDDALSEGLPVFAPPGTDVCVALTSSGAVSQITMDEMPYDGVRGVVTDLGIKRAAGAPITPFLSPGWMVPMAGRIWNGAFNNLFHAPLTGGEYTWHTYPSGYGFRYAGILRPDGIYALRESGVADMARLYRIVDATGTPLETPEPVDVLPPDFTYVNRRLDGLAFDGTQFIVGTTSSSGTSVEPSTYYSIPATGGAPTLLGTNDSLHDVGALAADADYLYVAGRVGSDEGIWRLRRDQLTDPAQTPHLVAGNVDLVTDGASIAIDDTTAASVLYFRTVGSSTSGSSPHIHVVVDPRAETPRWSGILWRAPGGRQDNNFGYDPVDRVIYLIDTNDTTLGTWLRLD